VSKAFKEGEGRTSKPRVGASKVQLAIGKRRIIHCASQDVGVKLGTGRDGNRGDKGRRVSCESGKLLPGASKHGEPALKTAVKEGKDSTKEHWLQKTQGILSFQELLRFKITIQYRDGG